MEITTSHFRSCDRSRAAYGNVYKYRTYFAVTIDDRHRNNDRNRKIGSVFRHYRKRLVNDHWSETVVLIMNENGPKLIPSLSTFQFDLFSI